MVQNILEKTLAGAKKDQETVRSGEPIDKAPDGVTFHDMTAHLDDRGSVTEIYDTRWNWHPDPLVFCYMFTIRPRTVKGWALHKLHEDRYFVVDGEMEVVLYDPRPESSTCGQVFRIVLSSARPRLMNIPRFVWHADHNIGTRDVRAINFPTMQYDHANPDKYRLPLDTDLIPVDFGGLKGW